MLQKHCSSGILQFLEVISKFLGTKNNITEMYGRTWARREKGDELRLACIAVRRELPLPATCGVHSS
jgi:hypothetical protein